MFEKNELGIEVSLEKNDSQLNRYGTGSEGMALPESVEELIMEEKLKDYLDKEKELHMDRLMGVTEPKATTTTLATKPLLKPSTPPLPAKAKEPASTPKKIIDKLTNQKITVTKTGKKRVAPMLISSTSTSTAPTQEKLKATFVTSQTQKLKRDLGKEILSITPYPLPRLGVETAVSGLRNKFTQEAQLEELSEDDIDTIEHIMKKPKKVVTRHLSKRTKQIVYPEFIARTVMLPNTVFNDLRTQPSVIVNFSNSKTGKRSVIEVRNYNDNDDEYLYEEDDYDNLSRLTRIISNDSEGGRRFEIFEQDKVTHAVGYEGKFWCLATETGILKFYSSNGMLLSPAVLLGSPIANLICCENYVACICNNGLVNSWDVMKRRKILNNVSVAGILNQFSYIIDSDDKRRKLKFAQIPYIVESFLNEKNGSVIIYLENDQAFEYSVGLKSWIKVIDPWYLSKGESLADGDVVRLLENRVSRRIRPDAVV